MSLIVTCHWMPLPTTLVSYTQERLPETPTWLANTIRRNALVLLKDMKMFPSQAKSQVPVGIQASDVSFSTLSSEEVLSKTD